MASKVHVPKFHDLHDDDTILDMTSGVWEMEENDVVDQLNDKSFKKRVEILEQLVITVKTNGGRLPYSDHESIFRGLGLALSDSNWEIRLKCIVLLQELIPSLQDDLDRCMSLVLGKLISNIGDSKVTLRKAVISCLHRYMKHTEDLPALLHAVVNTGLENENARVRREMINALPMLLTKDFLDANLYGIIQSLAKKLLDTSTEDNLKDISLTTLQSIENLLGEEQFDAYIHRLSPSLRKYYQQLTGKSENGFVGIYTAQEKTRQETVDKEDMYTDGLEFGCIPADVMSRINDQKDFRTRAQAVEDLKEVIISLTPDAVNQKLIPHIVPLISFLNSMLDDSNFKIITITLEILYSLIQQLGRGVKGYVKNIATVLTKRMGDNKIVIRQSIMQVLMKMMQSCSPQLVITVLCDNLSHRNSRVRLETVNFIIAALLTFPSYDFDLSNICMVVGPSLTDVKRPVRHAALECFAVLAQALGPGRLPLVQAVDQVEITSDGEGLMAAVQARLARRQLPRLNHDGLVEYATSVPSSATQRSITASLNADTEWVLAVGSGTARTVRSETMEVESVASFSTSGMTDSSAPTPAPRRFMSAGRGRSKLPWEEDGDERKKAYEGLPNSAPPHCLLEKTTAPPTPRTTWLGNAENRTTDMRKDPKRRSRMTSLGHQNDEDLSTGPHSIYQHRRRPVGNGLHTNAFSGNGDMPDFKDKDNGYTRPEQRTPRPVLDPISVKPARPTGDAQRQDVGESPVPHRAAVGRGGPGNHRGSTKVPPIMPSAAQAGDAVHNEDEVDSAYSASSHSTPSRTGSLRAVRSSAKNRGQQLFDDLDRQGNAQGNSHQVQGKATFITGISSTVSPAKSKKPETSAAADTKQKPSHQTFSSHKSTGDSLDINENRSTVHLEFSPNSGVTFRENRSSDVQVVGRGYGDENSSAYYGMQPVQQQTHGDARDRRRNSKAGSSEQQWLAEKDPPARSTGLSGVLGMGVRGTASLASAEVDSSATEDESGDDAAGLTKSSSFQHSFIKKQRMKKEQEEQAHLDRKQDNEQRQGKEDRLLQDQQQQKLKQLGSNGSLSEGVSNSSSPSSLKTVKTTTSLKPAAPAVLPRKNIKPAGDPWSSQSPGAERPPETDSPLEEWKPFSDPEAALRAAQKKLENDDWETKTEGLNMIRRIVQFHPETFSAPPVLHSTILLVVKEVKNLRSQVSRLAIVCLGDMFVSLKRAMDPDVDIATRALLAKAGESNNFIRDDVERSLSGMVEGVTAKQALLALIAGGATHKNSAVRRTTAQFVVGVVERMGSGKVLSGVKDITDRALPAAAHFAIDGSPETRYYGRKILFQLMSHPDFDRMLTKYLPANTLRNIQDVVENLKNKGLADKPNETASARSRRSGQGSRVGSSLRGGSANSVDGLSNTPPVRRKPTRTDEATMDEIKTMINQLSSSEWRVRYDAVSAFQDMCIERPDTLSLHIVKIFDKFLPRLQDPNSKVNLHALKVMQQGVPLLKEALQSVISMAVTAIVPNLASKNRQISHTANLILDSYLEHLDHTVLIQPFSNQAQHATGQSKAEMVLKVAYLTDRVYERKSKQIVLHVLPLLWHLLALPGVGGGAGSGELRSAMAALASTLHHHMGQGLLDRAGSEPSLTARHMNILQEVL
ncbi:TOG array regulator of axonemal microtubules protein 1-like isoform X3 [Babylonia areolata]|uniref:TOG array regulator of axonemal microtubules protein 1-like isoform X3 n=1 Tax=Babylonia areolata TaxID=304850 RepID=UPI003FD1D49B